MNNLLYGGLYDAIIGGHRAMLNGEDDVTIDVEDAIMQPGASTQVAPTRPQRPLYIRPLRHPAVWPRSYKRVLHRNRKRGDLARFPRRFGHGFALMWDGVCWRDARGQGYRCTFDGTVMIGANGRNCPVWACVFAPVEPPAPLPPQQLTLPLDFTIAARS